MTMRTIILLFFLSTVANAQVPERRNEFGLTIITINSILGKDFFGLHIGQYEPSRVFLDGIFYRHSYKQFGLRAFSAYSKYNQKFSGDASGSFSYKDFKVGVGGQYNFPKEADWVYTFFDAAYNRVNWSGSIFSDTPDEKYSYIATGNGLDLYFGLGFKLKIFDMVSLSPELSYDFYTGKENNSRTSLVNHQTVNNTFKRSGNHPVFKLHLSFIF